jgi:hypothetical protein
MTDATPSTRARQAPNARERILEAAYELFSRQGIRAVVIDSIVESWGVARMTLYRHFVSKDAPARRPYTPSYRPAPVNRQCVVGAGPVR